MKKEVVSEMMRKYLAAKEEGKEPYFDSDQIEQLLNHFEDENDYGYFDEVLALGLKLHPDSRPLQIKKCHQLIYTEAYEQALDLLDYLGETDDPEIDMLRIECYCSTDNYPKAVGIIEEMIEQESEYLEETFEYICPIIIDLGMDAEARHFVDWGLKLFPDNITLKDERCFLYEADGDLVKAIHVCEELLDHNPFSYEHWFTLGRLQSMIGEFGKAIESFDFALACDDSDPELKIVKAYCLFMNESYEKALEIYEQLPSDEEMRLRIVPLMAECKIKLLAFEEAYQSLKTVIHHPHLENHDSNYINYILCCSETDREREAMQILFGAARLLPKNPRILSLVAIMLSNNTHPKDASTIAGMVADVPLFPEAQDCFTEQEQARLIAHYEQLLKQDPRSPLAHIHLAIAYLLENDMDKFLTHIRQVNREKLVDYLNETEDPELRELALEYLRREENKN